MNVDGLKLLLADYLILLTEARAQKTKLLALNKELTAKLELKNTEDKK